MVEETVWEHVEDRDSHEILEVAKLYKKTNNTSWFGVDRRGGWVIIVESATRVGDTWARIGELHCVSFSAEERISWPLLTMLDQDPPELYAGIAHWPLVPPIDSDELWDLLPWRQAVLSALRVERGNYPERAASWIDQLGIANEFSEELQRISQSDSPKIPTSLKAMLERLANS